MLNGSIFTIATGVIWTLVAVIYSAVAGKQKHFTSFMFFYSAIFALLICIFQTPQNASAAEICKVAYPIVPAALLGHLGFFALYLAMKKGSHAVAWTFTQSAMVMPFLGSWLFFNSQVKWVNFAGLALVILALCGLGASKKDKSAEENKNSSLALIFSMIALLLTGLSQFCSLLPGELGSTEEALSWRLPIYSVAGVILWGAAALIMKAKIDRQVIKYGTVYGLVVAAGQVALYMAIDALASVDMVAIVYPAALSICIILFAVYCAIFRKEKLSKTAVSSLLLLLCGVILLFWK